MSRGWWSLTWAAQNRVKYLQSTGTAGCLATGSLSSGLHRLGYLGTGSPSLEYRYCRCLAGGGLSHGLYTIGLKGTMSRDFLLRRLTDEVVPVFVVELGRDGDDSTEEVGHETQMFHLGLPLYIVLPQAVTPKKKMQED